jgi:twitching motility protein PilT
MDLNYYFKCAIDNKASDLHLVEGSAPSLRINGELIKIEPTPIPFGELKYAMFSILESDVKERFLRKKDIDLSMNFFDNHFRVNLHYQEGKIGLTARMVPDIIPNPEQIGFNETIYKLTHLNDGLILVTGPSGAGKSTTLAAMIDIINLERKAHIITIEDPIEFTFQDKQSIIEQRELGRDTRSFAEALKYALRQDPNIIMVGEMRDLDTISAALNAAQTGHLVLSTLHTSTAPETIGRIMDYFPHSLHTQVANQIASVLRAVITQQLLPQVGGGLVAAREIMINNTAISNLIRQNQLEQINSVIQTHQKEGMMSMNMAINNLFKNGLISDETAKNRIRDMETHAIYY